MEPAIGPKAIFAKLPTETCTYTFALIFQSKDLDKKDTWTALEELENKNAAVLELKSCGMREICQPAKLKICLSDHLKLWTKKTVAFKWHY